MKNINSIMEKFNAKLNETDEALIAYKKKIANYKNVKKFLNVEKEHITTEMYERYFSTLSEFVEQDIACNNCPGFKACPNMIPGFKPNLSLVNDQIVIQYAKCDKAIQYETNRKLQALVQTSHMPIDIKLASLSSFQLDTLYNESYEAVHEGMGLVIDYKEKSDHKILKGLYLYGAYGVGKTYLLGAIANEFAKESVPSAILYWPDFLRELKGSFENNTLNTKIEQIRNISVLMIDDIGAEVMSPWSRDEILGTILQYRMQNNLLTCFSSNYSLSELERYYSQDTKGHEESVKAERIIQRISYMARAILMTGENRRSTS